MSKKKYFLANQIKRFTTFACLTTIVVFMNTDTYAKSPQSDNNTSYTIIKGTNIAHWLSQTRSRREAMETFFTEKDVVLIKELGFDHIRIPIDEEIMWDQKGNQIERSFSLLRSAIQWCQKHGLRAIVDLHILRSHYFNAAVKPLWTNPEEQDKFVDLWIELSAHLRDFPNELLAYELLNEAVADDHEDWNKVMNKVFQVVRKLEPERTIVIGSNRFQAAENFDVLRVPNDRNIILSFHFYEPFLLTHYKTRWTFASDYTGPVHYPGTILTREEFNELPLSEQEVVEDWVDREFDRDILEDMMEEAIVKAKALDLPLYCGEFGIFYPAPREDSMQWYRDTVAIFEKNGIAFSNWCYKSNGFGIRKFDGSLDQEHVDALISTPKGE